MVALLVGGVAFTATAKTVDLTVNGEESTVRTHAQTVGEVVAEAGVEVDDLDVVRPTVDERVTDGLEVEVSHARLLTLTVDGVESSRVTTEQTLGAALAARGVDTEGTWVSLDLDTEIPVEGLTVEIRTPKNVTLVVGGESSEVSSTAGTVGELLDERDVEVRERDQVGPTLTAPLRDGMTVSVVRIDERLETVRVQVPAPVTYVDDGSLYRGTTKVVRAGSPGLVEREVRVVLVDGVAEQEEVLSERVISEPEVRVIARGTKTPPPAPAASTASRGGSSVSAPSGTGGLNWAALARCESGGNPRAVSASGTYRGLYQFSMSTWRGVGGVGDPIDASPAEQTNRAQILYSRSGASPWPHCGRYL